VDKDIFHELFVLEAANNHWGRVQRGLDIVQTYGALVRHHNIRAAIKFQFRDRSTFIHPEHLDREDIRYIKKTQATWLKPEEIEALISKVRDVGCIPMATPFDEASVDLCVDLEFPLIKIASSDINDWSLLERVAMTKKPVIASSGGASEKSLDELVTYFERRNIPLALNHCVSLYPSEDHQLELNQITYLRSRYPDHVIGFSSHEYHDWRSSMLISYALGARSWERHVDIEHNGIPVSPYCSLPNQADEWFKAFHKAKEMLGNSADSRRIIPREEVEYLDTLVRGVYARRDLPIGYELSSLTFSQDFKLAVPLLKGQLSTREILNGLQLTKPISLGDPLTINDVNGPYAEQAQLRDQILNRGL